LDAEDVHRSIQFNPFSPATRFCLAAMLAHLDRVEEAGEAARARESTRA
jgi:hypothetical protein